MVIIWTRQVNSEMWAIVWDETWTKSPFSPNLETTLKIREQFSDSFDREDKKVLDCSGLLKSESEKVINCATVRAAKKSPSEIWQKILAKSSVDTNDTGVN